MLLAETILVCIQNEYRYPCFPYINMRSVRAKRTWNKKTPEERKAYSEMRSEVQKRVFKENPRLSKIRAESFRKVTQKYWDSIDEDRKQIHVKKMSEGMQKAWDESDESFGPLCALQKVYDRHCSNLIIKRDVPRINNYSGVITASELSQL